jgi:ribosome-binding protein aMBF1 (putative translation factor)
MNLCELGELARYRRPTKFAKLAKRIVDYQITLLYTFGMDAYDYIRQAIRESRLSQYRIAKNINVSRSQLCLFMQGKRGLSFESFERLLDCLDLELIIRPRDGKDTDHHG